MAPANVAVAAPVAAARAESATPAGPRDLGRAKAGEWMAAIFGDRYDAKARRALTGSADEGFNALSFVAAAQLEAGRVAVIVNGTPADAAGAEQASHAEGGDMHVFVLRSAGAGWQVSDRYENVANLGSHGHFGAVKWIALAPGKPGFIVSSGGVWQGYEILSADIFALAGGVQALGSFNEHSGNSGACGPEADECWDIGGKISVAPAVPGQAGAQYADLVVDFTGERYKVTEDAKGGLEKHHIADVKQTARYRFDGKAYKLVAGENPVPGV
ncbi:hypothetical protein [Pseudoduganella flava]|uniref:Uncharacterized protein n=1 Tax=Pseudoduganella flava TaxID=871742 RepID=A0ABX6FYC3_9BURK|nr:hypothetical protein [Pseudoduganella flava]QGZ42506.1 hypothetical protein GO485_28055 [Pseudoduganella flava]